MSLINLKKYDRKISDKSKKQIINLKSILMLIIFIFLIFLFLNFKFIKLKKSNVEQYLDLEIECSATDMKKSTNWYSGIICEVQTDGISKKLDYKDVELTVRVFGTYGEYKEGNNTYILENKEFEMIFEPTINFVGKSKKYTQKINLKKDLFTHKYAINYDYEIIKVNGVIIN